MRKSHDGPKQLLNNNIYRRCTVSFTQTLNTIMAGPAPGHLSGGGALKFLGGAQITLSWGGGGCNL